MINYDETISPFNEANFKYIATTEELFQTLGATSEGFCNSYGYDVEINFLRNNIQYQIKLHKHQSTQNGVVVAVESINYSGTTIQAKGINCNYQIQIGKSLLKRLFTFNSYQKFLPSPFYIRVKSSIDKQSIQKLFNFVAEHNIYDFKLKKNEYSLKSHTAIPDILKVINELETIL